MLKKKKYVPLLLLSTCMLSLTAGCTEERTKQIAEEVQMIPLVLSQDTYVDIPLPAGISIITDNQSFIDATDDSFKVTVFSNALAKDVALSHNVSTSVGFKDKTIYLDDTEQIVIYGPTEDKTIFLQCKDSPTAYDTFVDYVANAEVQTEVLDTHSLGIFVEEIPQPNMDVVTIESVEAANEAPLKYFYGDGDYLVVSKEVKKYGVTCSDILDKIDIVTGDKNFDTTYAVKDEETGFFKLSDTLFYGEIGDYTVAVVNVNFNTADVFYGKGDIARQNIRYALTELK